MIICTMGFAQKNARAFFELLKENKVEILNDKIILLDYEV